ncbi:hypothetical protein [Halotalea alkalilenta]|nr:hypothetical protein [Halotalea alkalilenta]
MQSEYEIRAIKGGWVLVEVSDNEDIEIERFEDRQDAQTLKQELETQQNS